MKHLGRQRRGWTGLMLALSLPFMPAGSGQTPGDAAPAAAPTPAEAPAAEATPAAPAAPAAQEGLVTANLLNVRARPAPHYERLGQFMRGDTVTIVGGNAEWLEVRVPLDTRAWIAAQYLKPDGSVAADQVRLHSGPGLVFTSFVSVSQGTKLDVLGPPVDGWQQVRAPAVATGWVSRAFVRVATPEPPPEPEPPPTPAVTTAPGAEDASAPTTTPGETPAPVAGTGTAVTAPDATSSTPAVDTLEAAPVTTPAETAPGVEATPPAETATPAATAPAVPVDAVPVPTPTAEAVTPATTAAEGITAPTEPTPETSFLLTPPADAPILMKEGILLSLKERASEHASHVLCTRIGTTAYPICHLKSTRLDLGEWENRSVRVYGPELRFPGWTLPVMHVHSIQVNLAP